MRLHALSFTGAFIVLAAPLSTGAQAARANHPSVDVAEQSTRTLEACPAGWVWEPAGYFKSGRWDSAHCAPRDLIQNW